MTDKTEFVRFFQNLDIFWHLKGQSFPHIINALISFADIGTADESFELMFGLQTQLHLNHVISMCLIAMDKDYYMLVVLWNRLCL